MKKRLRAWQLAGFVFTGVLGVLLHFLFDWSGQNLAVAPFAAVNESIWEHMKLLFFPMLVFALAQRRVMRDNKSFWCIKLIGILLGTLLIPVLYYTIRGISGVSPDWVNIIIFFVAVAIAYWVETWIFSKNLVTCKAPGVAQLTLLLIAFVFVIMTFAPPHIPLFEDPGSGTYGYVKYTVYEK
ncbi:MAG: hypothetical protein E7409_03340 [Ruminococcaceae bacterium]|nr:hypothetical protein [Oscillospiraceae bacterium]